MEETLNIEYHIKRVVCRALNTSDNVNQAAQKLGLSPRTVFLYKKVYNVRWCTEQKQYISLPGTTKRHIRRISAKKFLNKKNTTP